QDRVFVVTGGGNGIGRETTLELLRRGASVAAVDVMAAALDETRQLAGVDPARLSTHVVNLTDRAAVEALPGAVIAAHGQIDGVLNIAGIIQRFVPFAQLTPADIEKVMAVNFWGVIHMCETFLPHLLERPQAALLNVS